MKTLPEGLVPYRTTPVFTEHTIPAALRGDHSTKAGVWARITVREGLLRYTIAETGEVHDLRPGVPGVVEPESVHRVAPLGRVEFSVEFFR